MKLRSARLWALSVLAAGLAGEALMPAPAFAAMINDGFCADSCLDLSYCDGAKGSSCTIETCYNHMNIEFDYVIRCAMDS